MDVWLSPHNDDETLFGAFTCLRYKPTVIVLLRSFVETNWQPPIYYEQREPETAKATEILGCEYVQWEHRDDNPDWEAIRRDLLALEPGRVWAPLPEHNGHAHHNAIGEMARDLFFPLVSFYATYTYGNGKSTHGTRVKPEPEWVQTKREAMSCYASQAGHPNTHLPFDTWAIDEYLS